MGLRAPTKSSPRINGEVWKMITAFYYFLLAVYITGGLLTLTILSVELWINNPKHDNRRDVK